MNNKRLLIGRKVQIAYLEIEEPILLSRRMLSRGINEEFFVRLEPEHAIFHREFVVLELNLDDFRIVETFVDLTILRVPIIPKYNSILVKCPRSISLIVCDIDVA